MASRTPLDDIAFAGRIEPQILADICASTARRARRLGAARLWDAVVAHIATGCIPGRGGSCAGVPECSTRSAESGWVPALLTGNMTRMADIKLEHFGIGEPLRVRRLRRGGHRPRRARAARRGARRRPLRSAARAASWSATPRHDIACARAAGAKVVAVATGSCRAPARGACAPTCCSTTSPAGGAVGVGAGTEADVSETDAAPGRYAIGRSPSARRGHGTNSSASSRLTASAASGNSSRSASTGR